jgi:hypothetical protein
MSFANWRLPIDVIADCQLPIDDFKQATGSRKERQAESRSGFKKSAIANRQSAILKGG